MSDIQQVITTSTLISSTPGVLSGLVLSVSGSAAATVTCYDNTSAGGKVIFQAQVPPASVQGPLCLFFAERFAPRFLTGLYVSLGLGVSAVLWARSL